MSGQSFPPPQADNDNPFGSSSDPFGQQPSFGQQQSIPNFGGTFDVEEKRRNRTGLACLIIGGGLFACIACCLLCIGIIIIAFRAAVPALFWVQLANDGSADETAEIVCADSQAETFSLLFAERYGNDVNIVIQSFNAENDVVTVTGTFETGGQTLDYEADFTIDPGGDGFLGGFFGCIETIDQVQPPFLGQ